MLNQRTVTGLGAVMTLLAAVPIARAVVVSTAFTHQGRLTDGGSPANGAYDFEFKLFDAATAPPGVQIGATITVNDLVVSNGLFTVTLDFGAQFNGEARWLELSVRQGASVGGYTMLLPRQALTAAPYALGVRLPLSETVDSSSPAMFIQNTGTGRAAYFESVNPATNLTTVRVDTHSSNSEATALAGVNFGTGYAGYFEISNPASGQAALRCQTNGTGPALYAAGDVQSEGSVFSLNLSDESSVFLGWATDQNGDHLARIRVAGNGVGASNGLDIQRPGNVSILRITHAGYVGIGTVTPVTALQVNGDLTFQDTGGFSSGKGEIRTAGDIEFNKNIDSATNDSSWFRWFTDADTIETMRISSGNDAPIYGDGPFSSNGIDYAEAFKATEPDLEPGDVVSLAIGQWEYATRSTQAYDPHIVGVVSTQPGFVTGMSFNAEDAADPAIRAQRDAARAAGDKALERELTQQLNQLVQQTHRPIALIGRVPCKVDASYGAIQAGDRLTSSPTPGRAMKQTQAGLSVGIALEGLDSGTGVVMVLVQPGWHGGASETTQRIEALEKLVAELMAARQ